MCDKLVFDLSQEVEGSPNVFVRKDWINILDNQNQNYSNNQSIIDTSQLSNSNKYMSYREAYLAVPMLLTIAQPSSGANVVATVAGTTTTAAQILTYSDFGTAAGSGDYCLGLKNWFGTMIHSFTMDYNGSTIIQQTPYINMWNSFKLMTSLSLQDIQTQGTKIGFFPDDPTAFVFNPTGAGSALGVSSTAADFLMDGTCNNSDATDACTVSGRFNSFFAGQGNSGFLLRQQSINFNPNGLVCTGTTLATGLTTSTYGSLLNNGASALNGLWKSYVLTNISGSATIAAPAAAGVVPTFSAIVSPVFQINVMATIMLKHIHGFFNMCPLLKGVFMKLTLNLNNTSTSLVSVLATSGVTGTPTQSGLHISAVANPVGGVNPLMIASPATSNGGKSLCTVSTNVAAVFGVASGQINFNYSASVCVGANCLDNSVRNTTGVQTGNLSKSIYLYVPAYTFNPVFEQAYLSSPVKQIKYTDVYQYQITNIPSNGMINNLVTNGIANIKSILVLPFYSPLAGVAVNNLKSGLSINNNTNIFNGTPVWQSPFDPAGTGPTSPLCHITNFNIQISGQNAIYNLQKYVWEQFNNQLYGQNAVNGGLTDGLTSGLVGRQEFDMEYCYYYVNVERMLPVEEAVPKSVQIIGQNLSAKACDYYVFVEYGVKISIDALTGARV
jgi:hypothetical protein